MQQHPILIGKKGRDYLNFDGSEHVALYARPAPARPRPWSSRTAFPGAGRWSCWTSRARRSGRPPVTAHEVLGQDVYLFDPAAEDERTHRWNPLQPVQRDVHSAASIRSPGRPSCCSRIIDRQLLATPMPSGPRRPAAHSPPSRRCWRKRPDQDFSMANVLRCFARGDSQDDAAGMIRAAAGLGRARIFPDRGRWCQRLPERQRRPGRRHPQDDLDPPAKLVQSADRGGDRGDRLRSARSSAAGR